MGGLCIIVGGDQMEKDKVGMDCKLIARGIAKADAKAVDDLSVPDPDPAVGRKAIEDATEDEEDEDS